MIFNLFITNNFNIKNFIFIIFQNIKLNYHKSILGFLWIPSSFIILVTVKSFLLIDILDRPGELFIFHLTTGLYIWLFFSDVINKSLSIFHNNQLFFNIEVKPILFLKITYSELLFRFVLNLIPLLLIILLNNQDIKIIYFVFSLVVIILLFFELFKLFSIIEFFSRDIVFFLRSSLIIIFFATPIIWETKMLNEELQYYLNFNPLYHVLEFFRYGLYDIDFNLLAFILVIIFFLFFKIFNFFLTNKIILKTSHYL